MTDPKIGKFNDDGFIQGNLMLSWKRGRHSVNSETGFIIAVTNVIFHIQWGSKERMLL